MAQVKKAEVREAILASALRLFRRRGYTPTTTSQIAAGAGVSESNIYVYFRSKLEIFFGIYEPWLRERVGRLETALAGERDRRARLRAMLSLVLRELPSAENGFTNNLTQALSSARRKEGYRPALLRWYEGRIEAMLRTSLPPRRVAALGAAGLADLSHFLVMAHDGFSLSRHLIPARLCSEQTIELLCDLLLGVRGRKGIRPATRPAAKGRSR